MQPLEAFMGHGGQRYFPKASEPLPLSLEIFAYLTPSNADVWLIRSRVTGGLLKIRADAESAARDCDGIPERYAEHRPDLTWRQACALIHEADGVESKRLEIPKATARDNQARKPRLLETYRRVAELVRENPGATILEIAELLGDSHHWSWTTTPAHAIRAALMRGTNTIEGVRVEWSEDGSVGRVWGRA